MQAFTEHLQLKTQHSPRWLLLIAAILLLATAARVIHSDGWPLWTDEGWSLWITAGHTPAAVLDQLAADRHPPLYFLLLGVWRAVAGDSRLALRLLSALCGVLATALTYRLGRDSFGRWAGASGALIFAALPLAVYYTQVVRHYGLLILLAALSALLFVRALRRPTAARIGLYALSAAAVLYTEYSGVLVIGTQVIFGLLIWRAPLRDKTRLLAGWIGAGLLYLPWAYVILVYQGIENVTRGVSAAPGTYATTPADLVALGGVLAGGQLALAGGLALLGGWAAVRSPRRAGRLYLLLGGAGLLGLMILGNLVTGLLANRTVAFLTPPLAVLAGAGLARLERPARGVLAASLIGLFLAAPPLIQPHMASDLAAAALATQYTPGDPVILEMGWDDDATGYELARALGPEAPLIRTLAWVDHTGNPEPVLPHVQAVLEAHDRVWVVNWLSAPQVLPYLDGADSGFRRVITQETPTGAAYAAAFPADTTIEAILFERVPTGEAAAVFGDLFALHGARLPATAGSGATVHIDLWWSALEPPPLDYSVGVFLVDSGGDVVAQHDGPPGGEPTTSWVEGDLHFDRHTLALPPGHPPGEHQVGVAVYWYGDNVPLAVNGETTIMIGTLSPP